MSSLPIDRRSLLKAAGAGLLVGGGLSTVGTVSAHEGLEASAEDLLAARFVPSNPDFGFNYPYYLYAPVPLNDQARPILVEPNNTGTATDDYSRHRADAENRASDGFGHTLSQALRVPQIVPAFPRPRSEPVDWRHYVHYLDTDTIRQDTGPLARVDLQVLKMAEHARNILSNFEYPLTDQIIMNGFSASGNFVNRFAALHPDKVQSVSAGGINGTAILPIEEDKGYTLNYQIGIADLESLIGEPFDLEEFNEVSQFLYMGGEDENDTIPYGDAWSEEQREKALAVYGKDMIEDRMPYCESVYNDVGADAEFRIYDGVGHKPALEMQEDVFEHHQQELAISRIELTGAPSATSTTVSVHAIAFETGGVSAFDIRVFSDTRGELTANPVSLGAGEEYDGEVELDSTPETGERITAVLLEAGATDQSQAIASDSRTIADESRLEIVSAPSPGTSELTVNYAVSADYQADTPPHVYLNTEDEERYVLTTRIQYGGAGQLSFNVDDSVDGVPFEDGDEIEVVLKGGESWETLAASQTVVGATQQSQPTAGSVEFAVQPIFEETEVAVKYSLDSGYSVQESARLELSIEDSIPMLLDVIEPGASATNTYQFSKSPLEAGKTLTLVLRDARTLASDQRLVLVNRDSGEDSDDGVETPNPSFSVSSTNPTVGTAVEFDASDSSSPNGEIQTYVWKFGDGTSGAGQHITHRYDSPATYTVTLRIVDAEGAEQTVQQTIEVEEPQATETSQPGFGIIEGLASIGGLGYLLKRRLEDETDDSE